MIVASQWKMSSSDLGPALQEVGGSFCKSARARDQTSRSVSIKFFARVRLDRALETRRDDSRLPNRKSASLANTIRPRRPTRATARDRHRPLETTTRIFPRIFHPVARVIARHHARASPSRGATRRAWNSTRFSRFVDACASRDAATGARAGRSDAPKSSLMIRFDAMALEHVYVCRGGRTTAEASIDETRRVWVGENCGHPRGRRRRATTTAREARTP